MKGWTVPEIARMIFGLKSPCVKCSAQLYPKMDANYQRRVLLGSLAWTLLLATALLGGIVGWWRWTGGAAESTSLACWLVMLALCGATGGYLRSLASYLLGLQAGLNLGRW